MRSTREVTDEETRQIEEALTRLQSLLSFPFTALELAAGISEEDVSDVFVRINSKGTPLNQADFTLTLMSVFWDENRTQLEQFCRLARMPSKGTASLFNHFIEPDTDQLLRVDVGYRDGNRRGHTDKRTAYPKERTHHGEKADEEANTETAIHGGY